MKKEGFFLFRSKTVAFLQIIASVLTAFFVLKMNVLTAKYSVYFLVALALITLMMLALVLKTKENTRKNIVSKIFSALISLALLIGTVGVIQGDSLLKKVTGATVDTHLISVVVMKDSPYEDIKDVKDFTFGANELMDKDNILEAKQQLEKEGYPIQTEAYDHYQGLTQALRSGEKEVILLSEAHRPIVDELDPEFSEDTRVIYSVKYEEEVEIEDKNTDVLKETFSFFVTGIDTYGPVSSVSRSDVNMIVTVDPKTHQILLTSIPRDYHVKLASFGAYDKLTHAGIYGVGESVKTLENLLDIDIDYYVRVNFSSVEQIVDALGGVDVYSHYTFSTYGGTSFQKGMNHVDGKKALTFVRERYNLPNGDNDRVRHQQELVKGMINKAMSPTILTNYTSILSSVSGSFETSLPEKDLKNLVKMQLDKNPSWDIQQVQLTGWGSHSTSTYSMPGWNLYVMEPNYDSVNYVSGLIHQMEKHQTITVQ